MDKSKRAAASKDSFILMEQYDVEIRLCEIRLDKCMRVGQQIARVPVTTTTAHSSKLALMKNIRTTRTKLETLREKQTNVRTINEALSSITWNERYRGLLVTAYDAMRADRIDKEAERVAGDADGISSGLAAIRNLQAQLHRELDNKASADEQQAEFEFNGVSSLEHEFDALFTESATPPPTDHVYFETPVVPTSMSKTRKLAFTTS